MSMMDAESLKLQMTKDRETFGRLSANGKNAVIGELKNAWPLVIKINEKGLEDDKAHEGTCEP